MKKLLMSFALLLVAALGLTACSVATTSATKEATTASSTTAADVTTTAEEVTTTEGEVTTTEEEVTTAEPELYSYDEYAEAELDTYVKVKAYVQAKQSWWDNKATVYLADENGAYFAYNMACSEENYAKLTEGTEIIVKGYKSEWAGETEITDATFEFGGSDKYVASMKDATKLLGTDDLANYKNQYVLFKGLTVVASQDADGNEAAWLYKYNGSGAEGDDLYFNVSDGKNTYQFTVESYLCGSDTDVYKAVKALNIGDKIDLEGYAYWYNGINPHITTVRAAAEYYTYDEYSRLALDSVVTLKAYVQAHQSWWENQVTLYLADADGAYFAYNAACAEEDAAKLTAGTEIIITGTKSAWAGEVELVSATFTFGGTTTYVAEAVDVTSKLGTDELINYQNQYVAFKNLKVVASKDADGNDVAYLYKYNGSGVEGDDLYFSVSDGVNTYTFTVESYLCGADTEVYKAVKALNVGDKIDLTGFCYWYNGINPHITSVTVLAE